MQEILKKICSETYQEFYKENLIYNLNLFSGKHRLEKPDLKYFIESVSRKIFDNLIIKDFTLTKVEGDIDCFEEFNKSFDLGNYTAKLTIYNIKEKSLNVYVLESDARFIVEADRALHVISHNLDDFFEYNNIREDVAQVFYDAKDDLLLNYNENINSKGYYHHIQYFLNLLYGENKKTENYKKILIKYFDDYERLIKMNISILYEENKSLFIDSALNVLLSQNTLNLNQEQISLITNYLKSTEKLEKIIKMLLTFQYAYNLFSSNKNVDVLDFTFIAVSLFKTTEIIFNDLLNKYWSHIVIKNNFGKTIDYSNETLELGKMNLFFEFADMEVAGHLRRRQLYYNKLINKLTTWISKSRNGFLHKCVLGVETLNQSVTDSIDITCLLILTLIK